MDIIANIGAKLRDANDALATAQKSWRDSDLADRESALASKELALANRERELASKLEEMQRLVRGSWMRSLKLGVVTVVVALFSASIGFAVGSSSFNLVSSDHLKSSASLGRPDSAGSALNSRRGSNGSEPITVSSDVGARYTLISWQALSGGNLVAVTQRVGRSGETFARREINCSNQTSRYLGEGETLAEAQIDRASPSMTPLITGSISYEVAGHVCSK